MQGVSHSDALVQAHAQNCYALQAKPDVIFMLPGNVRPHKLFQTKYFVSVSFKFFIPFILS